MLQIYLIDENCTELMIQVFDALNGIDNCELKSIKSKEVLKRFKNYEKKKIFIFSYFNCKLFKYLNELKMTIFGPQIILDCLRNEEQLPPLQGEPLYSSAMKGEIVCLTGLNKVDRECLKEKILMMSGSVSGDLIEEVTVLVAGAVSGKKYTIAAEKGIKIMSTNWVTSLWQYSSNRDPIDPWERDLYIKTRLPVLFNLSITVSGFSPKEMNQLKFMIEFHGASFNSTLTVGVCTHLITSRARGNLYKCAMKWKIHVVSMRWLTDSIERGYMQDECKYGVLNNNDLSIAESNFQNSFNNSELSFINESLVYSDNNEEEEKDEDEIYEKDDEEEISQNNDLISVLNSNSDSMNLNKDGRVFESYVSFNKSNKLFKDIKFYFHESLNSKDINEANSLVLENDGIIVDKILDSTYVITSNVLTTVISEKKLITNLYITKCVQENIFIDIEHNFLFTPVFIPISLKAMFNGLVFSISGFVPDEHIMIQNVCQQLGGIVQDSMIRKAIPKKKIFATTHLILSKIDKQKYLSALTWKIPAIKKEWLSECIKTCCKVPTDDFQIMLESSPNEVSQTSYATIQPLKLLPLESVVLYISKAVSSLSRSNIDTIADKLGWKRLDTYQETIVTHVMCEKELISDFNRKELITAEKNNKFIVSIEWLNQCYFKTERVNEKQFIVEINTEVQHHNGKRKICDAGNDDISIKHRKLDIDIIVMFSGVDKVKRENYSKLVKSIGGQVNEGENISVITHLICNSPGNNEKYFSALAAGKWILHTSYLDEVERVKTWVDECNFEFGGPQTRMLLFNVSDSRKKSQERCLAEAANMWREKGGGAFKDWKVGFISSDEKVDKLKNIIKCGGGTIITMSLLTKVNDITHVLVNKINCLDSNILSKFPCFKAELIQHRLMTHNEEKMMLHMESMVITSTNQSGISTRLTRSSKP